MNPNNHKILIFCALIILLCSNSISVAQGTRNSNNEYRQFKTSFGLESGFNFFTLRSDNRDYESEFALSAGFVLKTTLSPKLSISYGMTFMRRGAESNLNDGSFFNGEIDYNLNYLNFPININYTILKRVYLSGGMYYGRLVEAKFEYNGTFVNGFGEFDDDDFEKNDIGFTLGIAYNIKRFHIGLRFQRGFIDISDAQILQDNLGKTYNAGFGISLTRFF